MLLPIETWLAACWLRLELHELLDRLAALGEALLDPLQRRAPAPRRGPAGGARTRRRRRSSAAARSAPCRRARGSGRSATLSATVDHAVGPGAGGAALACAPSTRTRDPAQVLDQRQPQHDRESPTARRAAAAAPTGRRRRSAQACRGRPGRRRARSAPARCRRRAAGRRRAVRGRQRQARQLAAVAARQVPLARSGLLPRSGRSCRAATRPPACSGGRRRRRSRAPWRRRRECARCRRAVPTGDRAAVRR